MTRLLVAIFLLAAAFIARVSYQTQYTVVGIPAKIPLADFPFGLAGRDWFERHVPLEEEVFRRAGVTEYINAAYRKNDVQIWFYVGYYDGESVEAIHQPLVCFPASGWELERNEVAELDVGIEERQPFNLLEFVKGGIHKYTAYTFFYRGKFEADQTVLERGRVFDARNFAIITLAADAKGPKEAETLGFLQELAGRLFPRLLEHLPE